MDELELETLRYFLKAFQEVHAVALSRLAALGGRLHQNNQYPVFQVQPSGMPSIGKGILYTNGPPDYEALLREMPYFTGPLSAIEEDAKPELDAFIAFAEDKCSSWFSDHFEARFAVSNAVQNCVMCALYRYGPRVVSDLEAVSIIRPYCAGFFLAKLDLALIVPICLTRFQVSRFRLDENTFIASMPRPIQLSRSQLVDYRGGTSERVAEAATHAFVSKDWFINNTGSMGVYQALASPGTAVFELLERCFGSLRIATGIETGFAQVLFRPRRWQFSGRWDLPALYGSSHRRYPNRFDDWGWVRDDLPSVSKDQLAEVRRTFELLKATTSNKVAIATKRLNACLSRDDDVDALLDAIIGLEVLLGDGGEAVSFKLKMRAAALSKVSNNRFEGHAAFTDIGKLYSERSKIVHGNAGKANDARRNVSSEVGLPTQRKLAADYLRMILAVLMERPQYLDPKRIDEELLIGH